MPATIRDVAKLASVGVGTVSRVLNDSLSVSDETRQRVLAAMDELDYSPNPIARQLSTGRTLTIGVLLPHLTMPSYVERLSGVQQALLETEYDLVLFSVENPTQRDAFFDNISQTSRVDGILVVSLPPTDRQAARLASSSAPAVLVDAYHPDLCCVITDDIKGGSLVTKYLLDLGHHKIAYLSDFLETPFHPSMRYRYQGYRDTLEKAGFDFIPEYFVEGHNDRSTARQLARQLLTLPDPPSAIFAGCDIQAIGVLDTAREMGIRVPQDLSVIGYDGIRDAEYLNLTTIEQHLFESGVQGVRLLFDLLEKNIEAPCQKYLPIDLVVRGTTAPPIHVI
jgi:DNA-binding LacI/PurR family transcriptional regulator